jgi:hypothetical protein
VEVITAKLCAAGDDVGRSSSIRLYIRNLDADWDSRGIFKGMLHLEMLMIKGQANE